MTLREKLFIQLVYILNIKISDLIKINKSDIDWWLYYHT